MPIEKSKKKKNFDMSC